MTPSGEILYLVGAVAFVVGLAVSIGLHELGHMSVAKWCRVKVTDFSVGFGPKMWSRQKGETTYNLRVIPLGGFIRMIGMFPATSKAGHAEYLTLNPEDRDRTFVRLTAPRKAAIMVAGPLMNLILATVLATAAVVGFGVPEPVSKLGAVLPCTGGAASCESPSPAVKAGLLVGDRITVVDGKSVSSWEGLVRTLNNSAGKAIDLTVERAGKLVSLNVTVESYEGGGRIGISPTYELKRGSAGEAVVWVGDATTRVFKALGAFPAKTFELFKVLVTGAERDPASPVGVVGLARYSGEVASAEAPISWRILDLLMLLAGLNVSLFVFNMVPLLPLDGGHVFSALLEGLRRTWSRVRGLGDPGPFDSTKLLPLTYVVAAFLLTSALLVMVADIIRPIQVG